MDTVTWTTTHGDTVEVYVSGQPEGHTRDAYRFRVRAANGEIVATGSEGYTRKAIAVEAALRHHPRLAD